MSEFFRIPHVSMEQREKIKTWPLSGKHATNLRKNVLTCVVRRSMSPGIKNQIARWCHAKNGDDTGIEFARYVSKELFGRVLDRDD